MPNYNDAQGVADLLSQFDFNIISPPTTTPSAVTASLHKAPSVAGTARAME